MSEKSLPEGWAIEVQPWGHVLTTPEGNIHGVYEELAQAIAEARLVAGLD